MATQMKKVSAKRTEVESLTGTVKGTRYTVVLDDITRGDEWESAVLPMLQKDGIGKVSIADGVTCFVFKDIHGSTIEFSAKAGNLIVSKFYVISLEEVHEDDSASESV